MTISLITLDPCDMGIRALSAFLKKRKIKVKLIFLDIDKKNYPFKVLKKLASIVRDSKLIGISLRFISFNKAIQVTRFLKKLGIPIIVGGSAAISSPEFCLKHFDLVCNSEGEDTILELYNKIVQKKDILHVKGMCLKRGNRNLCNNPKKIKKRIFEMDYLCEDDYLLLENENIVRISKPPLFYRDFSVFAKNSIFIMSARDCPFKCSYCINSVREKVRPLRKNTMGTLIRQIKKIKKRCADLRYVYLFDDDFFCRTVDEIREFSDKYRKQIGLPFWVYGSPNTINREKLSLLVGAGLSNVVMGIQTGSEYVNKKIYDRNITNEAVMKAAKVINSFKDDIDIPTYDLIIANPFERKSDLLDTINLLKKLPKPFYTQVHILKLFPGTKLYERFRQSNLKCHIPHYFHNYHELGVLSIRTINLYLNCTILWTEGLWTEERCGLIYPKLLSFLLTKPAINFFNRNPRIVILLNKIYIKYREFYRKNFQKNKVHKHVYRY